MNEIALQSPQQHPLGAFEPDEVFVEYDAPLVFTVRGANDRTYLAYLAEAKPGCSVYLAVPIAPDLLAEVARGRAPVRAAFTGKVWVIVVHASGQIAKADEEFAAALPPRYLPPEQLRGA